jgi:hypothetical protein
MRKLKTVRSIIANAETKVLLRQKFRLSDTMAKRLHQLVLSMWEEIDAISDEAWDIAATELGYESAAAVYDDHKHMNVNWHTGEITLSEKVEPEPEAPAA